MKDESLGKKALKGGFYLSLRRAVSAVLGIVGALVVTNIVGPSAYGLFNASLVVVSQLQSFTLSGVKVYLVRESEEQFEQAAHLAFWWYFFISLLLMAVGSGVVYFLSHVWIRTPGFLSVCIVLLTLIFLSSMELVPRASLERQLDYKHTSLIDVGTLIASYFVTVPMALLGYGVWALVAGGLFMQCLKTIAFFAVTRYRPRWCWDKSLFSEMLRYGLTYSSSIWLYNLRELVSPLVLMPLAGEAATGYYALVKRFLTFLNFARESASSISIPLIAKIRDDFKRLSQAVNKGMDLQVLVLTLTYSAFALLSPAILPLLYRERWDIGQVAVIFPFVAGGILINSLFNIPASALYALKVLRLITLYNFLHTSLFLISALLLVPRFGLLGVGLAEIPALLPYLLIVWEYRRNIGSLDYRRALLWTGAGLMLMLAPVVSWWLIVGGVGLFLSPFSLRFLKAYYQDIRPLLPSFLRGRYTRQKMTGGSS